MATINITVQSLLNAALYYPYTLDDSTTVGELMNMIQTDAGIDPAWYWLSYNDVQMNNTSATLADYSVVDGSSLRAGNIIAVLDTLQDRQLAKLNLASLNRQASGYANVVYDINLLPSQYIGNVSTPNDHPDGLVLGRPWVSAPPPPAGAFVLDWYGTVSNPVATTGTYNTDNGGITLDPNSYIDVGAPLDVTSFTITLDAAPGIGWNGNSWDSILGNEAYFAGTGLLCYISGGAFISCGPPNQGAEGPITDITDNVRRLYTFTFDGTTMSVYENGVLVGSNTPTFQAPTNNLYIGSRHDNGGGDGPYDSQGGTYYSLKVESTALTADEVLARYNAWAGISSLTFQSTVFGPPPYVPGSQIEDSSGSFNMPTGFSINGNNGSGVAFTSLTSEQLTFMGNSAYNDGYVWFASWGNGSTYSVTPVAVYYGRFGPGTLIYWILDPADPTYSTPVGSGTFNFPVTFTEGTTPTSFSN